MKKIILLWALMCLPLLTCHAQTTFVGTEDFGRLRNITYDPTISGKMYATSLVNHIVSSTDNGQTWTVLHSVPGNYPIISLKLTSGNTGLCFATENAISILNLSSNTITASFPIPQNGVDGAQPSTLKTFSMYDETGNTMVINTKFSVAFSNYEKTFYTANGGQDWNLIYYSIENDNVHINNVAISPANPQKVFLMRGIGSEGISGGLWVSEDGGDHWTLNLTGYTLDAITFNPANPNDIFLGTSVPHLPEDPEVLFRSTDDGLTWNQQPISWTDGILNNVNEIAFNPTNTQQIIVLEENEIVTSNDGGATWTNNFYPIEDPSAYFYGTNASFNPFNANQIAISHDLYPQFFDFTTKSLTQIKTRFFDAFSNSFQKYSSASHLYYGAQGGRFHKNVATDITSAYNVQSVFTFNPVSNKMIADPTIAGRVFIYSGGGFSGGTLSLSNDYGSTAITIMDIFANSIQELKVDPNNSNIIYVSTRSLSYGNLFKIDFSDLNNIIVTEINTPQVDAFGAGVVTGIVVSAADSNTIYISKKASLFKSTDGGQNWTSVHNGLLDINPEYDVINNLTQNPLNANQLTICGNFGIYTSLDSGESWNAILFSTYLDKITHSTLNPEVMVGTTYTGEFNEASIIYTDNNGFNWTTIAPEQLLYLKTNDINYDFDGTSINAYISSPDLGVVKYSINDIPLGIDNPEKNTIGMFPNPASTEITILPHQGVNIQNVTVYSISGQKVLESTSNTINVETLNNGLYLVKVNTDEGRSYIQKLVKK